MPGEAILMSKQQPICAHCGEPARKDVFVERSARAPQPRASAASTVVNLRTATLANVRHRFMAAAQIGVTDNGEKHLVVTEKEMNALLEVSSSLAACHG